MEKLDIPQGTLDLMILTILAREPMHGYGIWQQTRRAQSRSVPGQSRIAGPVAVYRLEQDGRLKATGWPSENNRRGNLTV